MSNISTAKTISSKLANFSVSSNHHPGKIKIENAWVIESLNLPSGKVSKEDNKSKWEYLKDISIETSNLEISLLISAMSHLHISLDVISGDKMIW